jgi:hypothetical protein
MAALDGSSFPMLHLPPPPPLLLSHPSAALVWPCPLLCSPMAAWTSLGAVLRCCSPTRPCPCSLRRRSPRTATGAGAEVGGGLDLELLPRPSSALLPCLSPTASAAEVGPVDGSQRRRSRSQVRWPAAQPKSGAWPAALLSIDLTGAIFSPRRHLSPLLSDGVQQQQQRKWGRCGA